MVKAARRQGGCKNAWLKATRPVARPTPEVKKPRRRRKKANCQKARPSGPRQMKAAITALKARNARHESEGKKAKASKARPSGKAGKVGLPRQS